MQVKDVMSKEVLKVAAGDSALDTGVKMDSCEMSAAVVEEAGKLLGIVSKETFISNITRFCDTPIQSLKVEDFMEADIDTVEAEDDLSAAVDKLLTAKSIVDRLPVLADGAVVGLISTTDLTHIFAGEMEGRFKVADLMHYNPLTVSDYTPLSKVVDDIINLGVKRVMVMSGEKLVGIISVKDISLMVFREKVAFKGLDPMPHINAEDTMTRNPITVSKKADASEAAKVMVEKSIGGIPVVGDRLEGIITRADLLKGYQLTLS